MVIEDGADAPARSQGLRAIPSIIPFPNPNRLFQPIFKEAFSGVIRGPTAKRCMLAVNACDFAVSVSHAVQFSEHAQPIY
jgi:hypothetical protein